MRSVIEIKSPRKCTGLAPKNIQLRRFGRFWSGFRLVDAREFGYVAAAEKVGTLEEAVNSNVLKRCLAAVLGIVVMTLAPLSCQEVSEPIPTLTQNQWNHVQEFILDEMPDNPRIQQINAVFGGSIELLGWMVEPTQVESGEEFTVTWYWHVIEALDERWEIFGHCDSGSQRTHLDHEAVEGLFPMPYWEQGQIIEDIQTVTLGADVETGPVNVYMGFWRRSDDARLPVSAPGSGTVQPDGRLHIGSFQAQRPEQPEEVIELTTLQAPERVGLMTIDGELIEADWDEAVQSDVFVHPNTAEINLSINTRARALWDAEFLYLGLTTTDTDIWAEATERDSELWEEAEAFEIMLDAEGDGRNYLEIQINALGTIFDAQFPQVEGRHPRAELEKVANIEGMVVAVHVNGAATPNDEGDAGWSVEVQIPWSSIPDFGSRARRGNSIRANFFRFDRDSNEAHQTVAWVPVHSGTFHQPALFGEIQLVPTTRRPEPEIEEGTGSAVAPEGSGVAAEEETDDGTGLNRPTPANPVLELQQPIVLPPHLRPQRVDP